MAAKAKKAKKKVAKKKAAKKNKPSEISTVPA